MTRTAPDRRVELLLELFLPNEIITAGIAALACAGCAGVGYAAVDLHLIDIGRHPSHGKFALRSDEAFELTARTAGIARPALHDGERTRHPFVASAQLPAFRHVSLIDFSRGDKAIGAVKTPGGRGGWRLRMHDGKKTEKTYDRE